MLEAEDLTQLRLLNLQLLRQLWAGQDAVRRSVARATLASSLDSSSSCNSTGPLSPETTTSSFTSSFSASPPDTQQGDPSDVASCGRLSSRVTTLPPAKGQHQASQGQLRSHSAPLLPVANFKDSEPSAGQGDLGSQQTQAPRPILPRQRKSRVTFCTEPKVPGSSWRLRPYLGYDWIAESLDSCSPITSKPEAFFSTLQKFREAHRKECTSSSSEPGLGVHESDGEEGDHECVFCYRVNRRLFLVPSDPGTPCRLCGTPREQQGPETLQEPAQVRVSVPLSVLDPPHRYHIHRRKSFDASDTLSLPRHCLLGWDILPPKPEKGSTPKSLDLWSSMSSTAHHRKLCTASPARLVLPPRDPAPTPIWSHPRLPQPHAALRIQP
ncbi:migration and invasion-inhibitory protein [Ochotona curzoniae]|uniref:migration and invasion-inhibitory protein n=1 Tax=Ochotona curzoniae TaxID=130825 RepID=UPI001B3517CA|nr:migration and invasion-inhibitory protein [Ochotona curzoniae]